MSRPPPTPTVGPPEQAQRRWREPSALRRVWISALSISVVLHLLGLILYAVAVRTFLIPSVGVTSPTTSASTIEGMRLIRFREVEETEGRRPDDPSTPAPLVQLEVAAPPAPVAEGAEPRGETPAEEEEIRRITNAERLRPPDVGDPRIWRFVDPNLGALSEAERYQISLWWRLAAWYDSLGAAGEAQRRALDWTFTDENGGKWGVSPGVIHLGNLTLPLPDFFAVPSTQRERVDRMVQEWEQIERQSRTSAVWTSWREAAKEIRERKDRERADTSGVRER